MKKAGKTKRKMRKKERNRENRRIKRVIISECVNDEEKKSRGSYSAYPYNFRSDKKTNKELPNR